MVDISKLQLRKNRATVWAYELAHEEVAIV
jgi:hypothetical protein